MPSKKDPRKPSKKELDELDLGDDPVRHDFGDGDEEDSQLLSDANQNRIAAFGTLLVFAVIGYFAVTQGYVDLGPLEGLFSDVMELYERFREVQQDGVFGGAAGPNAPNV